MDCLEWTGNGSIYDSEKIDKEQIKNGTRMGAILFQSKTFYLFKFDLGFP